MFCHGLLFRVALSLRGCSALQHHLFLESVNRGLPSQPCSRAAFLFKDFAITLSVSEDPAFPWVLPASWDWMDDSSMAWALEEGTSLYSWHACTWAAPSGNPPSSQKQALEVPAQPNIQTSPQIAFISQAQRTNSFSSCSILTLFCFFVPILGQCERRCALAFVGFNEARFDSISYQVSPFVCMGRRDEKCSFNWCQKRKKRKTKKIW